MARYAEGTSVDVEKSRAEMVGTLGRYSVRKFGWEFADDGDILYFEIDGKAYRMKVSRPTSKDVRVGPRQDLESVLEAEWRRRWRAVGMLLKMKLEFAESGDSTIEKELMPYLLLRDGQTLSEAITGGDVPLLLAKGAS